jgi:hypothetical protein
VSKVFFQMVLEQREEEQQQQQQLRQETAQTATTQSNDAHLDFFRKNPPRGVGSELSERDELVGGARRAASGAEEIGRFISNLHMLGMPSGLPSGLDEGDPSKKRSNLQQQSLSYAQFNQLFNSSKRTKLEDGEYGEFSFHGGGGSSGPEGYGDMQKTGSNVAELLSVTKSLLQRLEGEGGIGFTASELNLQSVPPSLAPSGLKGVDTALNEAKTDEIQAQQPVLEQRLEQHKLEQQLELQQAHAELLDPDADGDEPSKKEKAVKVKKIFLRILRKVMEIPNESPLVRTRAPSFVSTCACMMSFFIACFSVFYVACF